MGPRHRAVGRGHDLAARGAPTPAIFRGTEATGSEVYGSISYNNGTTNNQDHGLYVMNQGATPRVVADNIMFDNWVIGLQAYATAPTQFLDNIHLVGNVVFNNGTIGSTGGYDILLGGSGVAATGAVVTQNYSYRNDSKLTADLGWYFGPVNGDLMLSNYFVGTMEVDDWATAVVANNMVYSTTPASVYLSGQVLNRGNLSGHSYSGNVFYGDPTRLGWGYKASSGSGAVTAVNFASWKTATGFTNPGAYAGSVPPNLVVVRPNVYEPGRANIVVYNWALQTTVSVDVSGILTVGDRYVVQNVQDFYGAPAASGIYDGGALQLPMAAIPAPRPLAVACAAPRPGRSSMSSCS